MFSGLNDLISQVLSLFQWWVIVAPWEMAIRVRRGNRAKTLGPGMHFRIPVLDRFFVQRVRKRYMTTPTQVVTTTDDKEITISGGIAYSIVDISLLYNTLSDPEDVVQIETMALVADYIATHLRSEVTPVLVMEHVNAKLSLSRYGLEENGFEVTDFACVKTYRLIQAAPKDYGSWERLDTKQEKAIAMSNPR